MYGCIELSHKCITHMTYIWLYNLIYFTGYTYKNITYFIMKQRNCLIKEFPLYFIVLLQLKVCSPRVKYRYFQKTIKVINLAFNLLLNSLLL